MTDPELIEAVARAICTADGALPDFIALPIFPEHGEEAGPVWRKYIRQAQASITAYEAARGDGVAEVLDELRANSKPLGAEFEKVWADNAEKLYER